MILHKSKYVEISYEQENSLIIHKFLSTTKNMESDEFKKEMLLFVEMCEKYKPEKELVHLIDMKYIIAPVEQEWVNNEILQKYITIIKRGAFLVPTELFAQVSVEQTMDEEAGQKFVQQYFENEDEARKWLIES